MSSQKRKPSETHWREGIDETAHQWQQHTGASVADREKKRKEIVDNIIKERRQRGEE